MWHTVTTFSHFHKFLGRFDARTNSELVGLLKSLLRLTLVSGKLAIWSERLTPNLVDLSLNTLLDINSRLWYHEELWGKVFYRIKKIIGFCITHHMQPVIRAFLNFEFYNILIDLFRRNDLIQLRDAKVQSYSCQNILGELIFSTLKTYFLGKRFFCLAENVFE